MRKLLLVLFLLCSGSLFAATVPAANCTQAAVQSAINSAVDGDTVTVPSCSNTTWTTSVTITNKSITLQGNTVCAGGPTGTCTDNTNIVDGTTGNALNLNNTAGKLIQVTGMTLKSNGSISKGNGIIALGGTLFQQNSYRIHHNHILAAAGGSTRGIESSSVYYLIDNNWMQTLNTGSIQLISPFGSPDGSDAGFSVWRDASLDLGTNNADFIENNNFDSCTTCVNEDVIDAYAGAKLVIRSNQFTNSHIGFHGTDSGNRRSMFSFEIYSNHFTNNTASNFRALTVRGGTGVMYNNIFDGSHGFWNGITLMYYRSCPGLDQSEWHTYDGTQLVLGSTNPSADAARQAHAYTGTINSTNVAFCSVHRDKVCASNADCLGGGDTCTTFLDGGTPTLGLGRDQPGKTHDQATNGIYAWNNNGITVGTYNGGVTCVSPIEQIIASGRDYFDNTVKPGYTAFTFPHPLAGGGTPVVSDPNASPVPGVYSTTQNVTLTTPTSGAAICYRTDGVNPSSSPAGTCASGSTTYSTPISVAATTTIKAIATKAASTDSNVVSFAYTISVAGQLYVNNSGSPACSDTGGQSGDSGHPFCTVSYGVSRLVGGGTLNTMSGTYAGDFTITGPSGTSGAHTIIQCVSGQTCTLNGPGFNSGRMKITGGCSYIDFIGFTITNHNQGLYLDDDAGTSTACTNVLVSGITIFNVGQEGLAVRAGSSGTPRNFLIQNSTIHDTGKLDPNQNGEGAYIGNSSGIDITSGVTMLNNTIYNTPSECIELKGDSHDNIIDGNNLSSCIQSSAGFGNTGGAIEIDEPRNTATDPHQIIRNNVIHDLPTASGITKRGIRIGTGATVYNNILYNIGSGYSCILSNTSNFPRIVYHNTVDCSSSNAVVNSGTTIDSQNNLGPTGTHNLTISSPYFFNYGAHDYHIVQGAAPVGAGANLLATVPTDIAGFARANPPTIGAYEFINSNPPAPAVVLSCPSSPCTALNFGNQTISIPSAGINVSLTNNGTGTLNITSITITNTDAAMFGTSTTCGATLVANTNCSVTVTFTPTSTGAKLANLVFTNDASDSPQSIPMSGSGIVNPTPGITNTVQGAVTLKGGITIK